MAEEPAFHGLSSGQLRNLRLTDIRDGHLHLDEVRATGGDIRCICDLFGLSGKGVLRSTCRLEHAALKTAMQ